MSDYKQHLEDLRRLNPEDATPRIVGLEVTLGVTPITAQATYGVPSNFDFYIKQLRGYHRFSLLNTEAALAVPIGTNLLPRERAYIKMQNCVWTIKDQDRTETEINKGSAPTLATINPAVGGEVVDFSDSPMVIPAGNKILAEFTLKDTTALIEGVDSVYGIMLVGVLVPKRQRS